PDRGPGPARARIGCRDPATKSRGGGSINSRPVRPKPREASAPSGKSERDSVPAACAAGPGRWEMEGPRGRSHRARRRSRARGPPPPLSWGGLLVVPAPIDTDPSNRRPKSTGGRKRAEFNILSSRDGHTIQQFHSPPRGLRLRATTFSGGRGRAPRDFRAVTPRDLHDPRDHGSAGPPPRPAARDRLLVQPVRRLLPRMRVLLRPSAPPNRSSGMGNVGGGQEERRHRPREGNATTSERPRGHLDGDGSVPSRGREIPDHTTRVGNPPPRGLAGLRPLAVPSDAPGRRPLHAVSLDRSRHVGPDLGRSGPGPPRTVGSPNR